MSIIKDTFFGGAEKAAAKKQERSIVEAQRITQENADRARADINRLFPQAQQSARQGFQGAMDVFGQSLPAQTDVFTQGNVGAQQQILQGLPQMQNALFGNQVDYNKLQSFQIQQPDFSFFQQQLPQAQNTQQMNSGLGPFQAANAAQPNSQQSPISGQFNTGFQESNDDLLRRLHLGGF